MSFDSFVILVYLIERVQLVLSWRNRWYIEIDKTRLSFLSLDHTLFGWETIFYFFWEKNSKKVPAIIFREKKTTVTVHVPHYVQRKKSLWWDRNLLNKHVCDRKRKGDNLNEPSSTYQDDTTVWQDLGTWNTVLYHLGPLIPCYIILDHSFNHSVVTCWGKPPRNLRVHESEVGFLFFPYFPWKTVFLVSGRYGW